MTGESVAKTEAQLQYIILKKATTELPREITHDGEN
jgi:hypothetical protein